MVETIGSMHLDGLILWIKLIFSSEGNLQRIERGAFWNVAGMKELILPLGLEYIGYEAFTYAQNLQYVEIPTSVTMVEFRAFDNQSTQGIIINIKDKDQTIGWNSQWNPRNFEIYYGPGIRRTEVNNLIYWIIDNQATVMGYTVTPQKS